MAVAETARLIASLELKDLFSGKVGQIDKSLGKLNASIDHTSSRSYRAGQQIGTGIKVGAAIAAGAVGFLATNVAIGLRSLDKLDSTIAQTNAVLKSTKGAAGENAQAIRDLANKYEDLNATIDDTIIQSGENLLLTFTNIRTKAFEPALKAALDMNQALGGGEAGLQGTIQRLGKALNDPIKGLAQLGRVGVTFTKDQKDQITTAVKAGDTFKAQGIILAELNKRFGGSFLAGGQTTAGKVAKFKDAIDDLQRALATALLPVIGKVADALQKFLADPKVIAGVTKLGQDIAGLFSDENLAKGADFLKSAFATAQAAAPIVESAARATFGFIQAAVSLFKQLPAPLQGLLVGGFALNKLTGGLVTNIAGGLADLIGKSRGASPANPVFVSAVGGLPGAGLPGAAGGLSLLGALAALGGVAAIEVGLAGIAGDWLKANVPGWGTPQGAATIGPVVIGGQSQSQAARAAADAASVKIDFSGLANANAREDRGLLSGAVKEFAGKLKDDLGVVKDTIAGAIAEFAAATNQLAHPKTQDQLVHAAQELEKLLLSGRGGAEVTAHRIDLLRKQLEKVHDPKTKAALEAKLQKIEGLLPGRQFAARELAKADSILKSHESGNRKIVDLKAVQKALLDRGLPHAADRIREKIDEEKRSIAAKQNATTQAVKDKDLSVTLNASTSTNVVVNSRSVFAQQRSYTKYYANSSASSGK